MQENAMISLELAGKLRAAGLPWFPAERDAFGLPDRDMDEQVFVVSPLPALLQLVNGQPVVAFQASAEWALDYVLLAEAVWLPSEAQLREALADRVPADATLRLDRTVAGYSCAVTTAAGLRSFDAEQAENAYALALLALLTTSV
jgi:hypothetical protein